MNSGEFIFRRAYNPDFLFLKYLTAKVLVRSIKKNFIKGFPLSILH